MSLARNLVGGRVPTLLPVFLWCAVCAGQTTTSAVPEIVKPDLGRVAEILGVKQTKDDMRPALAAALASFSAGNAQAQEQAIHALVVALNSGTSRAAFGIAYYSKIEMAGDAFAFERDAKWDLGTFVDRSRLIDFIWKRAQLLEKTSGDDAAATARGALLLAANLDANASATGFYLLGHDLDAFQRIARTSAEQNRLLAGFFEDWRHYMTEQGRITHADLELSDRIAEIKQGEPALGILTAEMIALFQKWRRLEASSGPGDQFIVIWEAWFFRNAAKKRGDEEAVAQVDGWLEKWKADAKDNPLIAKWIDQALSRVGPVPRSPRIVVVKP